MGLFVLLLGGAALVAAEKAKRRAQKVEHQGAARPQAPASRIGTMEDFRDGFIRGFTTCDPMWSTGYSVMPPQDMAQVQALHNAVSPIVCHTLPLIRRT
jgi:hypothetical protein